MDISNQPSPQTNAFARTSPSLTVNSFLNMGAELSASGTLSSCHEAPIYFARQSLSLNIPVVQRAGLAQVETLSLPSQILTVHQ